MHATRRLAAAGAALLLVALPGLARERSASRSGDERLAVERLDAPSTEPGAIALRLDDGARRRLLSRGRGVVRSFPLPERGAVDLELEAFDVLAPAARLVAVTDGVERDTPRPAFRAFRGRVAGDPDSLVVLGFFDRRMAGFVRTWDAEFEVGPAAWDAARPGADELRVRRVERDGPRPYDCDDALDAPSRLADPAAFPPAGADGARLDGLTGRDAPASAPLAIDGDTLLEANLAVDVTVEFHDHIGSLAGTQDYVLNLLAQVSAIYESEVNTKILVGYLRVFTNEPDPYTDGSTSTSTLLSDLRSEWNAEMGGMQRTATHLFSVRPSGGAGLAYVDVLCNQSYGYGVSTISAVGQSWEKDLVAHEIGHNFASPHTHCYVPEIDQCATQSGCYQGTVVPSVGTIMSYCSSSQSVFHPRVKTERIRPAAEDAYPACMATAGLPGSVPGEGPAAGLQASKPAQCAAAAHSNDDGSQNGAWGYGGTAQMLWAKRFTPGCYPFRLERVDVMIANGSVTPGRDMRVLVYVDPSGSGDPSNAVLAHQEDVTVQLVSSASFNEYALSAPVVVPSGDMWIAFYDLVPDADTTYIATRDTSRDGDSWYAANTNDAAGLTPHTGGTWMIRAEGGAVPAGSVSLAWSPPCNAAGTPDQDFAVYQGTIGDFGSYDTVTCSTGRATSYLAPDDGQSRFYLVVPRTSAAEGSYGASSFGERSPAASACKPQDVGACD